MFAFTRMTTTSGNVSRIGIALLALCVQALPSSVAFGDGAIGTLGSIIGKAQIMRGGQSLPAKKGMEIFATDELITGEKTAVKIFFTDGGNFMAFEDSKVKISEYKFKQEGGTGTLKSAFDVAKGKVRFFVKPGADRKNDTKFKTSNAVMGIRGTSGFIDASNPNKTQLVVLTGKVEVSNPKFPSQKVMVPPNQMTDVSAGRAPTAPRAAPPTLMTSLNSKASSVDNKPDGIGADGKGQPASDGAKEEKKDSKGGPAQDEKNDKGEKGGAKPEGGGEGGQGAKETPAGGKSADAGATPGSGNADGQPLSGDASAAGGAGAAGGAATGGDAQAAPAAGSASTASTGATSDDAPVAGSSNATATAGATASTPDSAPEPVVLEKKNVFTPEGKNGIVVNDAKLTAVMAPPTVNAASAAAAATASVRQAQPPTDVIKQVTEVVKSNTDKAVETTQAVAVAQQQRTAAEAPKSKSVKVKIVLPANP